MGYDCGSAVTGDSLDAIIAEAQAHAIEFHGYTREELEAPDMLEAWRGAVKQSARPAAIRTPRTEDGDDREVKPH